MTRTGQVINHTDHLEKICQDPFTNVIVMDDFQPDTAGLPKTSAYLNSSANFKFNEPDARPGIWRLHFYPDTQIESILPYFIEQKNIYDKNFFSVPDDIAVVTQLYPYDISGERDSMLFDT